MGNDGLTRISSQSAHYASLCLVWVISETGLDVSINSQTRAPTGLPEHREPRYVVCHIVSLKHCLKSSIEE